MRKFWVISIAVFSLLFATLSCRLQEREIPLEDIGLSPTNNQQSVDTARGPIEVASIDITRVWTPDVLSSYRSDFLMESRFNADSEGYDIIFRSHTDVTQNPSVQHISSSHQAEGFPSEMGSFETELYIVDSIAYSKSNTLSEQWTAFKGELVDSISELLVNPQEFVLIPEQAQHMPDPEVVNGVLCWHYFYDETDFEGQSLSYIELNADLWVAVEGGFIVKSESFASGGMESQDHSISLPENAQTRTTYSMTDINADFTITLPPEAAQAEILDLFGNFDFDSEWMREDVPIPTEAEVENSFEDSIALHTDWTVQQTTDFMLTQLSANGWELEMEYLNSEDHFMGDFKKADDFLILSIEKDLFEPDQTSIHVEIKEFVPWSRTDIPLPQDAYIEQSFEGEVRILTFLTIQDAADFVGTQLEVNGWVLDKELLRDETSYIASFIKEVETLSLFINPAFDEQGRTRIEITIE